MFINTSKLSNDVISIWVNFAQFISEMHILSTTTISLKALWNRHRKLVLCSREAGLEGMWLGRM